jgi:hypothetical protein
LFDHDVTPTTTTIMTIIIVIVKNIMTARLNHPGRRGRKSVVFEFVAHAHDAFAGAHAARHIFAFDTNHMPPYVRRQIPCRLLANDAAALLSCGSIAS